jgi:hypothetical protein
VKADFRHSQFCGAIVCFSTLMGVPSWPVQKAGVPVEARCCVLRYLVLVFLNEPKASDVNKGPSM